MTEQEQQLLLEIADDELILGWRDSEWTGIAPLLEEDVAFSSIAQNEIGHARALYELVARERGTTADELAFDRSHVRPAEDAIFAVQLHRHDPFPEASVPAFAKIFHLREFWHGRRLDRSWAPCYPWRAWRR